MGERYVCLEDVQAAEIGLDYSLGVVCCKGAMLVDVLPTVKAHLVKQGKIISEADYEALNRKAPANKRGVGATERK